MKRIAVLTSGGDASSMNRALSAFASFALENENIEIYFVYDGYKGLWQNKIYQANLIEARIWYNQPGSRIFCSRFKELANPDTQKEVCLKIVENLKQQKIDCLVVIGGDGSYQGAKVLTTYGVNVICMPGTIDNDIASTSYSIGFDTSLNTIVESIGYIKSCMQSHRNIALIEIMGRRCSDLTVFAGIATDADIVITQENLLTPQELLEKIRAKRKKHNAGIIILVSELLMGVDGVPTLKEYADYIAKNSNESVRTEVLGRMQRGGRPSAMDMLRATMLTRIAIDLIENEYYNKILGFIEFDPIIYDLEEGLSRKNPSRLQLIKKFVA